MSGESQVTLESSLDTPGLDARALSLSLDEADRGRRTRDQPGSDDAPDDIKANVIAEEPVPRERIPLPFEVTAMVDPVPGMESVTNTRQITGGADIAPTGVGTGPSDTAPLVRADVLGPHRRVARGRATGLGRPVRAPAGVDPDEVSILVSQIVMPAEVSPPSTANCARTRPGSSDRIPSPVRSRCCRPPKRGFATRRRNLGDDQAIGRRSRRSISAISAARSATTTTSRSAARASPARREPSGRARRTPTIRRFRSCAPSAASCGSRSISPSRPSR